MVYMICSMFIMLGNDSHDKDWYPMMGTMIVVGILLTIAVTFTVLLGFGYLIYPDSSLYGESG